jgi:SAM-dependent methyltransferase
VLELGCGSGDDALTLASQGVRVHATDLSPGMIEVARAKAAGRGFSEAQVRFEARAAEDCGGLDGAPFDGAFSNFGALNCADLARVGAGLSAVLRKDAPVVLCVVGPRPLPGLLVEALTGRPARGEDVKVGGRPVAARALTARDVREGLGSGFSWATTSALGVLVPPPAHDAWAQAHPMTFGLLASAEGLVRGWPLLRGLGDHVLLEGRRR